MTIAEDQEARSSVSRLKYAFAMLHRCHVGAKQFQRTDRWHRDTLPPAIINHYRCTDKIPVQIYLTSDVVPTVVQSEGVAKAGSVFERSGSPQAAKHSRQLDPYEIVLMNDYVYHRGAVAEQDSMRNFLVVLYAARQDIETILGKKSGWRDMFKLT
jgi:hypothetical protein